MTGVLEPGARRRRGPTFGQFLATVLGFFAIGFAMGWLVGDAGGRPPLPPPVLPPCHHDPRTCGALARDPAIVCTFRGLPVLRIPVRRAVDVAPAKQACRDRGYAVDGEGGWR